MSPSGQTGRHRPALVTWLSLGVLTLAAFTLGGSLAGLTLPELPYSVPKSYLLGRNALWAAWGGLTALFAFLGRRSAVRLLRVGGLIVLGWYWADRSWLTQSEYTRDRWPLAALFTALAVALVAVILSRPRVREYFQENRS